MSDMVKGISTDINEQPSFCGIGQLSFYWDDDEIFHYTKKDFVKDIKHFLKLDSGHKRSLVMFSFTEDEMKMPEIKTIISWIEELLLVMDWEGVNKNTGRNVRVMVADLT